MQAQVVQSEQVLGAKDVIAPPFDTTMSHNKDDSGKESESVGTSDHSSEEFPLSFGIRRVEILNKQYELMYLRVLFFFCIFLVSYVYSLDGTLRWTLQGYATSSYSQHSLLATVGVIRSVVAAAAQPTYARLSDKFGRLELVLVSIIFYAMGTVIESQAYDIYRFAGGAVLYSIGYQGIIILIQVLIADFSNLNWRLTCSFVPALPFIINTWVSGDILADYQLKYLWNYGIGMWAFIFPLLCIPMLGCMVHMYVKAKKTPEWERLMVEEKNHNRALRGDKLWLMHSWSVCVDLFWDLDVIGILFIICVFGFILVPFTIAGGVRETWAKASTIAPLVIGIVLIPAFCFWEAKAARLPILPFPLMRDRGVWSALIVAVFINFIWYMPNGYMYTVLVVGLNASVKAAQRITSLYSFVSVITGPLLGLLIVRVRRLKPFIVFGTITWAVSMGLLFHYRGSNDGVDSQKYLNGVIGALCLMGFGAGFFTYLTQVSIETCTNHEHMAVVLSLYLSLYNIGSALGSSISGAIWSNRMLESIESEFAKLSLNTTLAIEAYSLPFTFIVNNTWGSPERTAVALGYAHVQRYLCVAGLVLCFPLILATLFLRDHRLDSVQSLAADPEAQDKKVVVNTYDDDLIFRNIKNLFKRN